ncbi:MAG: M48 family metallopeptidase [Prevotella sp.]
MQYVGVQSQIRKNNRLTILLLLMFPVIILGTIWVFLVAVNYFNGGYYLEDGTMAYEVNFDSVNAYFLQILPYVLGAVGLWFVIAYYANASMIMVATKAQPLKRSENPKVYNMVENLCMSIGMDMPQVNIVNDPQLNAFASGINKKTYAITLTTGIIDRLNDEELAGVIAHELTHIRNHDTKLLITSIVFVGIVSTIMTMLLRMLYYSFMSGGSRRSKKEGGGSVVLIILIGVVLAAVAYFFTLLTRFAISRKREYMADAGGAEITGNPLALASALRKISGDPGLDAVNRADIAQMFIMYPDEMEPGLLGMVDSLFSTHPDVKKRIAILEQF